MGHLRVLGAGHDVRLELDIVEGRGGARQALVLLAAGVELQLRQAAGQLVAGQDAPHLRASKRRGQGATSPYLLHPCAPAPSPLPCPAPPRPHPCADPVGVGQHPQAWVLEQEGPHVLRRFTHGRSYNSTTMRTRRAAGRCSGNRWPLPRK